MNIGHHFANRLGRSALAILLLFGAAQASATPASVAGSYTGTGSGQDSMCSDPVDNQSYTFTWNLTITQDGHQFQGQGRATLNNADGSVDKGNLDIAGQVDSAGVISAGTWQFIDDVIGDASGNLFNGKFSGGKLTTDFSGSTSYLCQTQGSLSGSTGAVNPSTSGGSVVTAQPLALQATQITTAKLQSRTLHVLNQNLRPHASNFAITENGDNGLAVNGRTGLAAGDAFGMPLGLWGSFAYSSAENDHPAVSFDLNRKNFLGGVDVLPLDNVVVGIALGYENADVDTTFNGGNQDVDGFTVAPYVGWVYTHPSGTSFGLDASGGFTNVNIDQYRTNAASARVTSELDADRYFWTANATLSRSFERLFLSLQGGLLWTKESQDAYTESDGTAVAGRDTKQNQWNLGAEAAYSAGSFEPYARISYERDFNRTRLNVAVPAGSSEAFNDMDNARGALGIRYFGDNGISGSFEWNRMFSRDDYDEDNFSLFLRVDL